MDIALSAEQEAQLAEIAARDGRSVNDLAADAVVRYLDEERRFAEAVKRGIAAADRGEFVAADEVWARVERVLED
jgi:predicted transcriptional regulator